MNLLGEQMVSISEGTKAFSLELCCEFEVKSLIDEAKAGTSFGASGKSTSTNVCRASQLPSLFPAASTPPLSPRSVVGSPQTMKQRSSFSSLGSLLKLVKEPVWEVIPQFYFQAGPPPSEELRVQCNSRVDEICNRNMDGLQMHAETVIYRIFYYINRSGNGHLTLRELRRGNLIAAMQHTDEEEDINKVLRTMET